jgi:hypothetical protein
MTTVFAYHRVADYDFWRAGYARAIAATPEVRSYRIWRGQDDPNYVITAENFDSREVAERVWTSEETKTAVALQLNRRLWPDVLQLCSRAEGLGG